MADSKQDPWWLSLLSAIIGGLLVVLGQWIDNRRKAKQERLKDLQEIYYRLRKIEAAMRNNYRELAMAKTHVEYWWYCYNTTFVYNKSSDKMVDDFYKHHLEAQKAARQIETKIGKGKAAFIGNVKKFELIKTVPIEVEKRLLAISDLKNEKAKPFDQSLDYDVVRNDLQEKYETELRQSYYNNLADFKAVNDTLQGLVS